MLFQILTGAPIYAYCILPVLVWYGWMQSRTRAAGKAKVLMLPIIMTILSFGGVVQSFGPRLPALLAWIIGFALAAIINQVVGAPRGVAYQPATRRFQLPGSWIPLALMMLIYLAKYVVGATAVVNPDLAATTGFVAVLSLVFGVASGIFFSRFLRIWSTTRPTRPLADETPAGLEHRV